MKANRALHFVKYSQNFLQNADFSHLAVCYWRHTSKAVDKKGRKTSHVPMYDFYLKNKLKTHLDFQNTGFI